MITITNIKRSVAYDYFEPSKTEKEIIDLVADGGYNLINMWIEKSEITNVRNGGFDSFQDNINYAHSKNLSVLYILDWKKYCPGDSLTYMIPDNNPYLAQYETDMAWFLNRYKSTLDSFELEEPGIPLSITSINGGGQHIADTIITPLFRRIKERIESTGMKPDFFWGFNSPSNSTTNIIGQGFDIPKIDAEKLFTYIAWQSGARDLSGVIYEHTQWKSRTSNIQLLCILYPFYVRPSWQINPGFWDNLRYILNNNVPVAIFTLDRTMYGMGSWPNEPNPNNCPTPYCHIKELFSSITPCPKPQFIFNINQV